MKLFGWYRMLMRNPQTRWLVIIGSLLYLISPIDLSPDLFPLVGQVDDIILVSLLFSEMFQWLLGSNQADLEENNGFQSRYSEAPNDPTIRTVDVDAVSVDEKTTRKNKNA
ncbi:MAG: YkvA family protein [Leptolyngbyaceae bacterium]|nr:YkvA family protein [Leptolyngbyaceae bacterium]